MNWEHWVIVSAGLAYIAWLVWRVRLHQKRMRSAATMAMVTANLDNALENEHFTLGGHLYGATAEDIAVDLTLYAEDCENLDALFLLPYVDAWLRLRLRKDQIAMEHNK